MKRVTQKAEANVVRIAQLAQAFHFVGKINHYMVGVSCVFSDEELDRAEQILIGLQNKGPQKGKAFQALERALDAMESERTKRKQAAQAGASVCRDCGGELQRSEIVGGSKKLDKNGRCPICAEVHAEAEADDAEKLAEARRLVEAADQRKPEKFGRCECCVGDTPHAGAQVHKKPGSRCTRTASVQLRKAEDKTIGGKLIPAGPWSSYCAPCAEAIEAYQRDIVERRTAA